MTNSQINKTFLKSTDSKIRGVVLSAIADHYGITKERAMEEVCHEEAEHLLEYLTGSIRLAASVLMQKHSVKLIISDLKSNN